MSSAMEICSEGKVGGKKNTVALSKHEIKLLDRATTIATIEPAGNDYSFMHSILCQVGLPRSKVKGTTFERKCGRVSLLLSAGKLWDGKEWVQQPLPYGPFPRLLLAYMNTYAVLKKTPVIPVGNSKTDFLHLIGKSATGGKTGTLNSFNAQIKAFSACNIQLGGSANGHAYTYDGKPVRQFDAWIKTQDGQLDLWPESIIFSQDYYETLIAHAVPQDMRAIISLSKSALALDIYFMLVDRLHRIDKPVYLHWANLYEQCGQEYTGKNAAKDFKKAYLVALNKVLLAYPKAIVKPVRGGVVLKHSPPPIPYKTLS